MLKNTNRFEPYPRTHTFLKDFILLKADETNQKLIFSFLSLSLSLVSYAIIIFWFEKLGPKTRISNKKKRNKRKKKNINNSCDGCRCHCLSLFCCVSRSRFFKNLVSIPYSIFIQVSKSNFFCFCFFFCTKTF